MFLSAEPIAQVRASGQVTMEHILSKGKEQVTAALEQATAAMSVGDEKKQASQQPKAEASQGAPLQTSSRHAMLVTSL